MPNYAYIIIGFSIIFIATSLGSAVVYVVKKDISQKVNTIFLGFAAGVMLAALIWSLIIPSIQQSQDRGWGAWSFVPTLVGFLLGGVLLIVIDKIVPHLHSGTNEEEGLKSNFKQSTKLVLAVTIHNIPEGLAIGFAFCGAYFIGDKAAYIAALGLAVGMAIQNFPEGVAVSLPMRLATGSKNKAFFYGVISGVVEPIAAVLGFFLAKYLELLQPWLLAFSAGAMLFVVAEDLIPDAKLDSQSHVGTWAIMFGFAVMMVLEVALG